MTDETTEIDVIVDIDTWLGNPLLMCSDMRDHSPEHALALMPDVSREGWWLAVVEQDRTLLVRQSHPGSEDMVGLLFEHLSTMHPDPTAYSLSVVCAHPDAMLIQDWLRNFLLSHPDGVVVADLDKDQPRAYALN